MKSDDDLLQNMKQQKRQTNDALRQQSAREIKLFLEHIKKEHIAPDTRYFSITRMKFVPLWTIYYWFGDYDSEGVYVSSAGKLYEFRGIGYIAPASRYGKLYIGETLAHMRESREKKQAAELPKKKRCAPWRLVSR
jgi:hypothetical protein